MNAWTELFREKMKPPAGGVQLTGADVERLSGGRLKRQNVNRIINDESDRIRDLPTYDTVKGVAEAFGMSTVAVLAEAASACEGQPLELTLDELRAELARRDPVLADALAVAEHLVAHGYRPDIEDVAPLCLPETLRVMRTSNAPR